MSKTLDELTKLNDMADALVAEVRNANKHLYTEYKRNEVATLDKFMDDMRELAEYAKKLNYKTFLTGIKLDFYNGSYGNVTELIVSFEYDGNFIILANPTGYTYRPRVYDDRYADCGIKEVEVKWPATSQRFVDGWSWEAEECKRFIALHANEIIGTVHDMICDQFEKEINDKTAAAISRQKQIVSDIENITCRH